MLWSISGPFSSLFFLIACLRWYTLCLFSLSLLGLQSDFRYEGKDNFFPLCKWCIFYANFLKARFLFVCTYECLCMNKFYVAVCKVHCESEVTRQWEYSCFLKTELWNMSKGIFQRVSILVVVYFLCQYFDLSSSSVQTWMTRL